MTTEFAGVGSDSEPGTHLRLLSRLLARRGWEVHVLFCGDVEGEHENESVPVPSGEGIAFHLLQDLPAPPGAEVPHFGGDDPIAVLSEHALEALGVLHAEHRFDLIEFPDRHGLGLRPVQAKAGGDALLDVPLAVKLYGTTRWQRERALKQRAAPRDLKVEFCERHAFERADVQLSASQDMLDYVRGIDWEVRDEAAIAYPYPDLEIGSLDQGVVRRAEIAEVSDPELWNDRVEGVYRGFVRRPSQERVTRPYEPATVTVAVAHYNHDQFLPGALASLAAQTSPAEEVIVVDDGSSSEAARRVFSEQEALYPDWTFERQENAGPGAARNRGLELASGAYFLPFDSDNVATPQLVEKLLGAMELNASRAATTCHNLAFVEDADIEAGEFVFRYAPTGGPRLSACVENVYGDTCALFRTEALRSIGGFETPRWSPYEDWETFVKLTMAGLEVEVLPQPLFYYRTDPGGRLRALTEDPSVTFRQQARLIDRFFADAELTPRERRDLWECLQAFDRLATEGVDERLEEQRSWHDSQMADLHGFRLAQLEEMRTRLGAEIEAQRTQAEAAEGELASLSAITPRRLLRRALRAARRRVSGSSRSMS